MPLITEVSAWPRRPADLPSVALPQHVLMADPASFTVEEVHNPFMAAADGQPLRIDFEVARQQWLDLFAAFRDRAGLKCVALPAVRGLADLCFTANPSLALPLPNGSTEIWIGRMAHASRKHEETQHERYFRQIGFEPQHMPDSVERFECHGDGILHPGRFLMHVGVGPRSSKAAWEVIAKAHPQLDLLMYDLQDPRFYHLDTALAALDETTALFVPQAFNAAGMELLHASFPNAIALSEEESLNFAGNAFCPDKKHVFLQAGCSELQDKMRERGFTPVPVQTSEFMKSGGSVFCLKMAY
jgi:N-dimethylarginine dimethylaminohydrolase